VTQARPTFRVVVLGELFITLISLYCSVEQESKDILERSFDLEEPGLAISISSRKLPLHIKVLIQRIIASYIERLSFSEKSAPLKHVRV
jgi:hypothetical protein